MTLQALYGTIPQIFGKGECARVSKKVKSEVVVVVKRLCFYFVSLVHDVFFSTWPT